MHPHCGSCFTRRGRSIILPEKAVIMRKSRPSSRWESILGTLGFDRRKKRQTPVQQHHRRALRAEPLEERTLLSVSTWDGGGNDGSWANPLNWSGDTLPGATDDLVFAGTTITANNDRVDVTSCNSLTFSNGSNITLTGNALMVTDNITVDSGVTGSSILLDILLGNAVSVEVAGNTTLTISGDISGSNYLTKTGAGTLSLAGTNTYTGGTTINNGTLKVENSAALVECSNGFLVNGNNAVLDLNGHSPTVGAVGLINGSIVDNSATPGTPGTLTGSMYMVLNGLIDVNLGSNAATLIKGTSGTVTLSRDNNYTGLTTVCGGELQFVGSDAWNPVLYGGGADIQDGKIIFDYTGGSTPATEVQGELTASYNGGLWDTDQFKSSTASANNMTLGWKDDGTAHVVVMYTPPADANLDGNVNFDDFDLWRSYFGHTDEIWSHADFDYDGSVDFDEFDIWRYSFGSSFLSMPPMVMAIARMDANPSNASSVQFVVAFSKDVSGVDANDFSLECSGMSGTIASVEACSPSEAVYIVTVNNVSGIGTLGLNLIYDETDPIIDASESQLTCYEIGDGSFIGDSYTTSSPFVWDGGGSDNHWSTAENWAGDIAPQAGDALKFVGTNSNTIAENDFPVGTLFTSIEFASSGFELTGNNFTLTDGIVVDTSVSVAEISAAIAIDGSADIDVAGNGALTISGVISGDTSLVKLGTGILTLSGANVYTGGTNVSAGTLALAGGDNRLPVGTSVTLGGGSNSGVLRLGDGTVARNQTLAGLTTSGVGTDNRVIGGGSGNAVLTLNIGDTDFFGGVLGGTGTYDNNLALVKTNTGVLVLTGANTCIGRTTMQAGILYLGIDAQSSVLTGGGADIQHGKIVFNYSTTSQNPAPTIKDLLSDSYNGANWDRGMFRSSTAEATGLTLGWLDDPAGCSVTVKATWAGDFSLNGVVNFDDFDIWRSNFGSGPDMSWQDGDYNYDGGVNFDDFDAWRRHFGCDVVADQGSLLLSEDFTYNVNLTDAGPMPTGVTGAVCLLNPILSLTSDRTNNDTGIIRVLIKNDGSDAVSGTFHDLPEDSEVVVDGVTYFITYKYNAETEEFDTGNDVALCSSLFVVVPESVADYVHVPGSSTEIGHGLDATVYTHSSAVVSSQYQLSIRTSEHDAVWIGGNPQFTFTSDSPSIATVSVDGLVTFWQTGRCQIVVESQDTPAKRFEIDLAGVRSGGEDTIQYLPDAFDASQNLLVVYNGDSQDSIDLAEYYVEHRFGVGSLGEDNLLSVTGEALGIGANALANIGARGAALWSAAAPDICSAIAQFVSTYVENSPLPIRYVIGLCGLPSGTGVGTSTSKSVPSQIYCDIADYRGKSSYDGLHQFSLAEYSVPLIAWLDCGSYDNTYAFIDKEIAVANAGGLLADGVTISGAAAGVNGSTWIVDDVHNGTNNRLTVFADVIQDDVARLDGNTIMLNRSSTQDVVDMANNPAAYVSWGYHSGTGQLRTGTVTDWANNGDLIFTGNAGWWIGAANESYSGIYGDFMADPMSVFSETAFGGTNYSNTPVCWAGHTSEPGQLQVGPQYFERWAQGWSCLEAAWARSGNWGSEFDQLLVVSDIGLVNTSSQMALSGNGAVDEGTPYTLTLGSVTDSVQGNVETYLIHWDDGQVEWYSAADVEMLNRQLAHTYEDGGNYKITVDIISANGSSTCVVAKNVTVNELLQAASELTTSVPGVQSLAQGDLQPIAAEAIARWERAGLDAAIVARLMQVEFVIGDLSGSCLGMAGGDRVYLDVNAAGHGWFIDSTPALDEEFASSTGSQRSQAIDPQVLDRIDLLTVIEHELGHIAGYHDLDASVDDLMSGILSAGVRCNIDPLMDIWRA